MTNIAEQLNYDPVLRNQGWSLRNAALFTGGYLGYRGLRGYLRSVRWNRNNRLGRAFKYGVVPATGAFYRYKYPLVNKARSKFHRKGRYRGYRRNRRIYHRFRRRYKRYRKNKIYY